MPLIFFMTRYRGQGPTNPGDQSRCPLASAPIEVKANLCLDWPISGIDCTLEVLNLGPREEHTPKSQAP